MNIVHYYYSSGEGEHSGSSDSEEVILPKAPPSKGRKSPATTTPKRNPVSLPVHTNDNDN